MLSRSRGLMRILKESSSPPQPAPWSWTSLCEHPWRDQRTSFLPLSGRPSLLPLDLRLLHLLLLHLLLGRLLLGLGLLPLVFLLLLLLSLQPVLLCSDLFPRGLFVF